MSILKISSVEQLLAADITGVTEVIAQDMDLSAVPQEFFLQATSLRLMNFKSSWREDGQGIFDTPPSVRELFCCNSGSSRGGGSGGGSGPKPDKTYYVPLVPILSEDDDILIWEGDELVWRPAVEVPAGATIVNPDDLDSDMVPPKPERKSASLQPIVTLDMLPAGIEKFYATEAWMGPGPLDFGRFTRLTELMLTECGIQQVVAWPPNVRLIYANGNHLATIPEFPATVEVVELNGNQLTSLPVIAHTRLHTLRVNDNQLTSLPELSATLVELRADRNQLASLPALPIGMLRLYARNNRLGSMPAMAHALLEEVYVCWNRLVALPGLPVTVVELFCDNNRISDRGMPELHEGLCELYCGYNKLQYHPALPSTITEFNGEGNGFGPDQASRAAAGMLRYQMSQARSNSAQA
jgi:Leucine-rich repeat (LRR) protein